MMGESVVRITLRKDAGHFAMINNETMRMM